MDKQGRSIGGYFSLELPLREREYHQHAIALNAGRNCLEYILRVRRYSQIYIPYYTCEAVFEPIKKLGINYSFYHINYDFELETQIELKVDEALLYINYFGLKRKYVEKIASVYGQNLIVDNTQAFYDKPIIGIDTFYSCRKFFGVADGAYLYCDKHLDEDLPFDTSWNRMSHLLKRLDLSAEEGYPDFQKQENALGGNSIRRMSRLTKRIMQSIDYDIAAKRRRSNYLLLENYLRETNKLSLPSMTPYDVPMIFPYLCKYKDLRTELIGRSIYVPRYWDSILYEKFNSIEKELVHGLTPLPIDQRYLKSQMLEIVNDIKVCLCND